MKSQRRRSNISYNLLVKCVKDPLSYPSLKLIEKFPQELVFNFIPVTPEKESQEEFIDKHVREKTEKQWRSKGPHYNDVYRNRGPYYRKPNKGITQHQVFRQGDKDMASYKELKQGQKKQAKLTDDMITWFDENHQEFTQDLLQRFSQLFNVSGGDAEGFHTSYEMQQANPGSIPVQYASKQSYKQLKKDAARVGTSVTYKGKKGKVIDIDKKKNPDDPKDTITMLHIEFEDGSRKWLAEDETGVKTGAVDNLIEATRARYKKAQNIDGLPFQGEPADYLSPEHFDALVEQDEELKKVQQVANYLEAFDPHSAVQEFQQAAKELGIVITDESIERFLDLLNKTGSKKEAATPNKYYNKADRLQTKITELERLVEQKKAREEDTKKERKKIQQFKDQIAALRKKIEKYWDMKFEDIEVKKAIKESPSLED